MRPTLSTLRWVCATLAALALPAPATEPPPELPVNGCGYISTSARPPLSEDLYPAEIRRIDGADVRKLNRHKLDAGQHAISVQELIGSTPRGYTRLRKLGNREVALVYKVITIDVEPNASYQVGARLHVERIDADRPHAYWEPVVWRTSHEDCN